MKRELEGRRHLRQLLENSSEIVRTLFVPASTIVRQLFDSCSAVVRVRGIDNQEDNRWCITGLP
ncbi:hypothetical protein [Sphingobacterium suaedae]|uniref:Uncharacterized protein n=1 Tax=Sphingobacterium suaedae TaxID=1686402 RepID=A0ABW5KDT0_9SPHI